MSEPYAPDGYPRVTPHLTLTGAHTILDFLVAVFGARVFDRTERPDGNIAHVAVRIGDSTIELAEATDRFGPMPGAIHISTVASQVPASISNEHRTTRLGG